jgi:hypothetical protein
MMTHDDQQTDGKTSMNYNKPQSNMNKYDEQTLANSMNKIEMHPSRSFKYLQEMTTGGGQQATIMTRTNRCFYLITCRCSCFVEQRMNPSSNGQPLKMNIEIQQCQPMIQVNATSSSSQGMMTNYSATDIDATDF